MTARAARNDGLDAARALAIVLVIVAHAALSYMVTPIGWAVQDESQHLGVDLFVWIVRAFVMPVFFWLSGYFSRAVFSHGGARGYLRHRALRIFAPLAIALVPCSLAVRALWHWGREVGTRAVVAPNVPKLDASAFPITLGHLWYLYYLLWFSAVALVIVLLTRRLRLPRPGGLALLAVPCAGTIGVLAGLGTLHTDTPISFGIDLPVTVYMGAFFAWGWLVHAQPAELARYARLAWSALALAPGLLVLVILALLDTVESAAPSRPALHAIVASGLFTVAMVVGFLGLCSRVTHRAHPVLRLASEASYWSYVAHLPCVVLLQIGFATVALPGPVELAAIVAITGAACLLTYELLVRRTRLRRILG